MDTAITSFVPGRSSEEVIYHRLFDDATASYLTIAHNKVLFPNQVCGLFGPGL